jgi:hypothetical protein
MAASTISKSRACGPSPSSQRPYSLILALLAACIAIALPSPMTCTVLVQDLQMRPLRTVTQDKELSAGSHQLSVDLGGLPAGVYLVQLQAGGRSYHQRIIKQ